jgi:branched-chain amino acid transport system permease protein
VSSWRGLSFHRPREGGAIDLHLFSQFLIAGFIMGILYCLMALGINFIYGIMKVINWSMGEFFMIGTYVQYLLITYFIGVRYWYVGVVVSAVCVFFLGVLIQHVLIKPMFIGIIEEKMEYATIVTIALAIFFRNLAVAIGGNRFVALIGALVLLGLFYWFIKNTWIGKAFQAVAQNRSGVQTAGIDVLKFDMLAFGIGTALAAAGGALLAPIFLVHPLCGLIPTVRGFEIIVIAGLGSIPGVLIASLSLGIAESMGSAFINPSYLDIYGFVLLIIILLIKPFGLFGKEERRA